LFVSKPGIELDQRSPKKIAVTQTKRVLHVFFFARQYVGNE